MLSHAGPMTLTAGDSALMFDILKGPDPRDHHALPDDGLCYCNERANVRELRVAYAPTMFDVDVDSEVSKCIDEAVDRIKSAFNAHVKTVKLDWEDPIDIFEVLWVAGRGVAYGRQAKGAKCGFGAGFANLVESAKGFDLADYLEGTRARAVYAAKVHRFFEDFDILLMPTVPVLPFDAELEAPRGMASNSKILPWTGWTPFTYPFNITGNPAASIPAGFSSGGLPVGLQVIGPRFADANVLAFCRALEAKADFFVMNGDLPHLVEAVE